MEEERLDPAQPRWSQTVLHITAELPHGQVLCCVLYGIERVVDSWEIVANNMEILWTLQSAPLVTSCILIEPECGADRHTVGPSYLFPISQTHSLWVCMDIQHCRDLSYFSSRMGEKCSFIQLFI